MLGEKRRVRLLLVDDSYLVRQSIKAMLEFESGEFEIVGEAENGNAAVELAAQLRPDVILMDINMPEMDGIKATTRIMATCPAGVVMISVQGEQDYLRRAMKAGAKDFLMKPFTCEELVGALRTAASAPVPALAAVPVAKAKARRGKVITVFSTKGGVGKTTIVANLAAGLSRGGREKVAAIDLDLEFGVLATMMGVQPQGSIVDLCRLDSPINSEHVSRILAIQQQSAVGVLAAPPLPHLASEVDGDGRSDRSRSYVAEVIDALCSTHDYVVIDTSLSFRDANLIAFDKSDLIVMVTLPEITALESTGKGLDVLLERLEYPREKVSVLLNRSDNLYGLSLEEISASLGVPLAYLIPSDGDATVTAANTGIPILLKRAKHTPIAEAMMRMVRQISGHEFAAEPDLPTDGSIPHSTPSPLRKAASGGLRRLFGML